MARLWITETSAISGVTANPKAPPVNGRGVAGPFSCLRPADFSNSVRLLFLKECFTAVVKIKASEWPPERRFVL